MSDDAWREVATRHARERLQRLQGTIVPIPMVQLLEEEITAAVRVGWNAGIAKERTRCTPKPEGEE